MGSDHVKHVNLDPENVLLKADALNNLTQMSYGHAGCGSVCSGTSKLTALTDALSHSTTYTYDTAGRLTTETDPLARSTTYTYDSRGNLITKTKPDGHTITYTYDADNRLTQKQYSDQSITQYQYDANGNMTYAGNSAITYNFTYDANNRVTGITDSNSRTIQYQYDASGNKTSMTTPENTTITYAYDAARRLTGITNNSGSFSIGYDYDGRRSTLTYPNNTYATYTYDYSSNLTRVWHRTQGGTTLSDTNYTYDSVNNRLTRTETAKVATYGYDLIYRLLQSALTDRSVPPNTLPGGEDYTYDDVGNRLTGPTGPDYLSYDNGNELQNLNATTYAFDYNGNTTQKVDGNTTTTYTYDDDNRLVGVQVVVSGTTTQVISYTYDPFGRRIQKNVNGTITNYVYDKEAIILAYDQYGNVQTRYIHGPGIDEPLSMDNTSQVYYYHPDGLGSIIKLTNASGSVVQSYSYDAFGNITSGTPTITQPYTYTAREYDPETGLYFYRARYYDSKAGRFLTRDPIGFKGGINFYSYTGNNPVNRVDPLGLIDDYPYIPDNWPPLAPISCIKCDKNCLNLPNTPQMAMTCTACMGCLTSPFTPKQFCAVSCGACTLFYVAPIADCVAENCHIGKMDECGRCR